MKISRLPASVRVSSVSKQPTIVYDPLLVYIRVHRPSIDELPSGTPDYF